MSESAAPPPTRSSKLRVLVAVAGYAIILGLAFRTIDRTKFSEGLGRLSLTALLLVVAVSLVHIAGRAFRYHLLLLRAGPREYGWLDGVRIFFIGLSASAVTPARAGDFIKAQLVRKHGVPLNEGLGLVFVERSLDLLVVATSIVLASFALAGRAASDVWRGASIVLLAGLVFGTLAASSRRVRSRLFAIATSIVGRFRPALAQTLNEKLDGMFGVWDTIFRSPVTFLGFFVYSAAVWSVEFLKLWLVLKLIGTPISVLVAFFAYPASIVAGVLTLLPFSEGVVGVTGVALLVTLGGIDSGSATVAVAVDRAASTLPPIALWLLISLAARSRGSRASVSDAP